MEIMVEKEVIDVKTGKKHVIKQATGKELIFISRIRRDGKTVELLIDEHQHATYRDDTVFNLYRLSITEDTWIAIEFNTYVVKLIKN